MAKFCTRCGRRLEEGEICTCGQSTRQAQTNQPNYQQSQPNYQQGQPNYQQSQPNYQYGNQRQGANEEWMEQKGRQAADTAKNMFQVMLKILKAPVTEIKKLAQDNSATIGLEFMILKAVIACIVSCILASRISDMSYGFIDVPYAKLIFLILLFTLGIDALDALFTNLLTGAFKGHTTIAAMFSVFGAGALYETLLLIVVGIVALLSPKLALIIAGVGLTFIPYMVYSAYFAVAEGNENKKLYAYVVSRLCIAIVACLILALVGSDFVSGFSFLSNYLY